VYKVFGDDAERAIELDREGKSRADIQKATGAVVAVSDATVDIEKGETFVVMGLSGSGKSTLIRLINRLFETTSGELLINDVDVTRMNKKQLRELRMRTVSMVFQHFGLFPHRTVVDNAAYGLEVQGVGKSERRARGAEALKLVGLGGWEDRYPRELSGGMQQRVGLARALATDAEILLMDEAFSALDPLIRREMQDHLVELQRTLHKTIVFITHDLNEAMRLGDRIAVMRDGKIDQVGTAEDILTRPANDYVAAFIQDVDVARVLTASNVMRRPRATVSIVDGPHVAMRRMDEVQVNEIYVVDREGKLAGVVRDKDLADAAKRGDRTIEIAISQDYPSTDPDTQLVDLFGLATEYSIPIAVVADGRLQGIIPRVSLLDSLSKFDGGENASNR
jgi:glycine betaine/proline transport system ATP-binding protein